MSDDDFEDRFMDFLLFRALKGDVGEEEQRLVLGWRQASPDNEDHYRRLERILELTASAYRSDGGVGETPLGSDLVGLAAPAAAAPVPEAHAVGRRRSARRWRLWLGGPIAAASVWAVLQAARPPEPVQAPDDFGVHEFVTGPADVTTVRLLDGTFVRLAPQSRLLLSGLPGVREVTLEGRAFFAVAKREGEPFVVKSRGGEAIVLGTRFEAEATGDELRLLVVEGRVALEAGTSEIELTAGQTARSVGGAISQPVAVTDVPPLLAWAGDFLVFQETPIEEVALSLEQHFGVEVEVSGNVTGHTVTAWFAEPTLEDALRVICQVLAARCSTEDGGATIQIDQATTTLESSTL